VHSVTLRADDGLDLHGWHILPDGEIAADRDECDWQLTLGRPVVLYFSGNAGNRQYRTLEFDIFTRLGCHVLVFDYRGYGDNPGSPSEERLAADARVAWRYATEQRGISPDRILLSGESLGGAVAVRLAADVCQAGTPPGAILLRSTFSSLPDVASYHYPWLPVRWLLLDRYQADEQISKVTCPILHIHGAQDTIVPIQFGRKLFAAAPERAANGLPKRFVEFAEADHNDILLVAEREFRQAVGEFLERLGSARKPAK
jgi:fermentation-respiration switch protein FrsA (DUF1100 family)